MASLKCMMCARYDKKNGCSLEKSNYFQFRDCMTEKKDYSFMLDEENVYDAKIQPDFYPDQ